MSNGVEKKQKKYLTNKRVHDKIRKLLKTESKQQRVVNGRKPSEKRKLKKFQKNT